MIKRLLIANRGEIACRIIKTAKKMGIETIAVYSNIDANSMHVALADHAVLLGTAPSQQSYLNREKIITLAKQLQVDAIHPGYGFLSEDSLFALQCEAANIIFIGPSSEIIEKMGQKSLAKKIMQSNGVPIIPGYNEAAQDEKTLQTAAEQIGYPILIKAAAGGGGKGMRLVHDKETFISALHEAKREAKSSFNDDTILLEKYLNPSRHIEIQLFSDRHGNAVYLFSRDCSIQRRHQKIIEEAPAINLTQALQQQMGEAAVHAAKNIKYLGAGTMEFLIDSDNQFYFMEMNTRLQVEHPVTEMITGVDLVEWQLNIAMGQLLPLKQNEIQARGHAIEARIYAEDPAKNFIPSVGKLQLLRFPPPSASTRIDTGVQQGDKISSFYDPMMAKLVIWAESRELAIEQLKQALSQIYIIGVNTNIEFLTKIIEQQDFISGNISTEFIHEHEGQLQYTHSKPLPDFILAAALMSELNLREKSSQNFASMSADSESPWLKRTSWRLNQNPVQTLQVWFNQESYVANATIKNQSITFHYAGQNIKIQSFHQRDDYLDIMIHDKSRCFYVARTEHAIHIFYQGKYFLLNLISPQHSTQKTHDHAAPLIAPMPSTIVEIYVKNGQTVKQGERLIVLEAMKMQHTITAPQAGRVVAVNYKAGDLAQEGDTLLELEAIPS